MEHLSPLAPLPLRVDFYSKRKRGVGLNFKERSEFLGICEYDTEQVLECFSCIRSELSAADVYQMCGSCRHKRNIEFFDSWERPRIHNPLYIEKFVAVSQERETDKAFVYFVSDGQFVKIGVAKNVSKRMDSLQCGNPRELNLLFSIPFESEKNAYIAENAYHNKIFREYKVRGEWFDLVGKLNVEEWRTYFRL